MTPQQMVLGTMEEIIKQKIATLEKVISHINKNSLIFKEFEKGRNEDVLNIEKYIKNIKNQLKAGQINIDKALLMLKEKIFSLKKKGDDFLSKFHEARNIEEESEARIKQNDYNLEYIIVEEQIKLLEIYKNTLDN